MRTGSEGCGSLFIQQSCSGCGGGGLAAGTATALESTYDSIAVHPGEPVNFDDMARSLESGSIERNTDAARSICDSLQARCPGDLTFAIDKRFLVPAWS